MKEKMLALLLAAVMVLGLCACGGSTASTTETNTETSEVVPVETEAEPDTAETPEETPAETSAVEETAEVEGAEDFTDAIAGMDFSGYKEMLKGLTTQLPIVEEPVTLSYFYGFESSTLNYIDGGTMADHQVMKWLQENTGVTLELRVVDKTQESDQFNLIIASGEYPDIVPSGLYSAGVEAAYEEDIFLDLGDYLEENMPNYWTIINSDQKLLSDVQDGDMFLAVYAVKDQVANPAGSGTFIRKDWLEDLNLEVPETYDELTEVLKAFRDEKGATEPLSLFNTISMQNGLLMGGFGSMAELSSNGMGDSTAGFYQEDGTVIYGATAEGTRKYLSWLHELYEEDLINFENMQNRETNPFSDLNAGAASNGSTGYIFTNQPFGTEYNNMAMSNGDENCNWWPVRDVAENKGDIIPFCEEISLKDMTSLAITSDCDDVEVALQFLDFGYSYEGSLLYNFGFQKGSGHDIETWDYDANGEPVFDELALKQVADATNIASGVVSTKDLAGVVFDTRLSFSFTERELACFEAWTTDKTTANILGSATALNAEEGADAASLYSDIITYVATSALQFINGDMDVDDDTVWNDYVAKIEAMNIAELTEIIQTAYDRANG